MLHYENLKVLMGIPMVEETRLSDKFQHVTWHTDGGET
jgi:hypothetical protein